MTAGPVWLAPRFAKQPSRCAARRKNVANDMSQGQRRFKIASATLRSRPMMARAAGVAAAEAIILLAEAIQGANAAMVARSLNSEAATPEGSQFCSSARRRGATTYLAIVERLAEFGRSFFYPLDM
jgi:hypothetical protein